MYIFKWKPIKINWKDETSFPVLISTSIGGYEQRKLKSERSRRIWTYTFKKRVESDAFEEEIMDFYEARKGVYGSFYLPSFMQETKLSDDYTAGQTTISVNSSIKFTDTKGERGNYLCIEKSGEFEVSRITDISGNVITIETAFNNNYSSGSYVHRAYKVRFLDSLERNSIFNVAYTAEIKFQEVL